MNVGSGDLGAYRLTASYDGDATTRPANTEAVEFTVRKQPTTLGLSLSQDVLIGGPGLDWLFGGNGNDSLDVADGAPGDTADGGLGTDTVQSDAGDTVNSVP